MAGGPWLERPPCHGVEGRHTYHRDGDDQHNERPVEQQQPLAEFELRSLGGFGEEHAHRAFPASAMAGSPACRSTTNTGLPAGSRSRSSVITSWMTGAAACAP